MPKVGPKLRFEVFKRDGFACQYCGRTPPVVVLEVDHVHARANGGTNEIDNLLTACEECNSGKGAVPLSAIPETLAAKTERQRVVSEQVDAYNKFLLEQRRQRELTIDRLSDYWMAHIRGGSKYVICREYRTILAKYLESLPEAKLMDAMDMAHSRIAGP